MAGPRGALKSIYSIICQTGILCRRPYVQAKNGTAAISILL